MKLLSVKTNGRLIAEFKDGYLYIHEIYNNRFINWRRIHRDDYSFINFTNYGGNYYLNINCKNKRLCSYTKYEEQSNSLSNADYKLSIQTTDDRIANILADEIEKFFPSQKRSNETNTSQKYITTLIKTNVYSEPNNKSNIIGTLRESLNFTILDESKYFYKIRIKNNITNELKVGWILKDHTK